MTKNSYIHDASCSIYSKKIVNKSKCSEEEIVNQTLFNKKTNLFVCEYFITRQDALCKLCMCQKCYILMNDKDSNMGKRSKPPPRRSQRGGNKKNK